jgi:hypothetical protein
MVAYSSFDIIPLSPPALPDIAFLQLADPGERGQWFAWARESRRLQPARQLKV